VSAFVGIYQYKEQARLLFVAYRGVPVPWRWAHLARETPQNTENTENTKICKII
jgi:hypothetical protein